MYHTTPVPQTRRKLYIVEQPLYRLPFRQPGPFLIRGILKSIVDSPQCVVCGRMAANPYDERTCKVGIHHCTCSPQLLPLYTDIREIVFSFMQLGTRGR